jgi:prophage DNA circulation protein
MIFRTIIDRITGRAEMEAETRAAFEKVEAGMKEMRAGMQQLDSGMQTMQRNMLLINQQLAAFKAAVERRVGPLS